VLPARKEGDVGTGRARRPPKYPPTPPLPTIAIRMKPHYGISAWCIHFDRKADGGGIGPSCTLGA
jgi:hypothetical protein